MFRKRTGILFLFFTLALPIISVGQSRSPAHTLEQTRIGEALVSIGTQIEKTALDCSHFVNSIFEQAGLYYKYQPSGILYRGTPGFKRVRWPLAGDLIVWPGHVGIVVDPGEKTFLSALHRGVRVSSYTSRYWQRRGHARFFRYSSPIPDSNWLAGNIRDGQPLPADGLD